MWCPPGRKIISKHGGAYDLWLQMNLRHATLVPAETLDESYETFKEDRSIDALAGLRSKLEGDLAKEPAETRKGYRVLDSDFMSVQQAIGVRKRKPEGEGIGCSAAQVSEHLDSFVCQLLQKQQIEQLIEEHKVKGKLFPAKL